MTEKKYKDTTLDEFENKNKNKTQKNNNRKATPQKKTPPSNSTDLEAFYRRYRHVS